MCRVTHQLLMIPSKLATSSFLHPEVCVFTGSSMVFCRAFPGGCPKHGEPVTLESTVQSHFVHSNCIKLGV